MLGLTGIIFLCALVERGPVSCLLRGGSGLGRAGALVFDKGAIAVIFFFCCATLGLLVFVLGGKKLDTVR